MSSTALPEVVPPTDPASDPHTRQSLESRSPTRHSFLPNSSLPEEEEWRRSRETSDEEHGRPKQGADMVATRAPVLHRGVGSGQKSKKRRVSWTLNFAPSNSVSPAGSESQDGGSSNLIDRCRDIHQNHQKRVSLITMIREDEEISTRQVLGLDIKRSIGLMGVIMQRTVSWIQHHPNEEIEDSEALDWSSRQAGPLYISLFVVIFASIFTAAYYVVGWKTHAFVGFGAITSLTLGIAWQKWMNMKRFRSLQLNMHTYNCFFVAIIFVAPVIIQLLEGGTRVCNKAADCITVSIVSPVCYIYISRFDLSRTQFRPSNLVLAMITARALIIIFSVVFSSQLPSTFPVKDEEEQHIHLYASNVFYGHLYIFPFVVVMITFHTIISGFKRRGARIEGQKKKNKERTAKLMDMVKGIVLLDVWSGELSTKHPSDWWRQVPVESWEDTAILNTDIAGFTKLSSLLGPEELIPIINCLFSAVDFAASCLDCWKCEMVGDCWVGITGGPIPCKDRALRILLLSWAINDIVEDISKRLGLTIDVRIGLHTGTVATSIVSSIMPRFLIFGKDAEIARLMEQSGERGKVLVSESFASLLPGWEMEERETVFLHTGEAVRCCYVVDPRPVSSQNHDIYVEALEESFPKLGTFLHLLKVEDNHVQGMQPDERIAQKFNKAPRFGGEFSRSPKPSASAWTRPNGKTFLRSRSFDSEMDHLAGWTPGRISSEVFSDSARHQEQLQAQPSGQRPRSPLALSSMMEGGSPLSSMRQIDARPNLPGSGNLTPLGVVTPNRRKVKPSESARPSPWAQDPASQQSLAGLHEMIITSVGEVDVDDSFSWARRRILQAKEPGCAPTARSPGNEHSSMPSTGGWKTAVPLQLPDKMEIEANGSISKFPVADHGENDVSVDKSLHLQGVTPDISLDDIKETRALNPVKFSAPFDTAQTKPEIVGNTQINRTKSERLPRIGVSKSCEDIDSLLRAKQGWSNFDPMAGKKMKPRGLKYVSRDAVQHMKQVITAHGSMTDLHQEVNHQKEAKAKSSPMKKNQAFSPFFHDLSGSGDSSRSIAMDSDASQSSHTSFYHSKNFHVVFNRVGARRRHTKNTRRSAPAASSFCRFFLPRFRIGCLITCSAVCIFQALAWSLDDHFVAYETVGMRRATISCSAIFATLCMIVAAWEAVGGSVACTASAICLMISSSIIFGFGWEDYHSRASILWSFLGSSILMASSDSLVDSPLIVVRISAVVHVVLVIGTQLLVARSNRDSCTAENLERMAAIPWSIHALYIIHQIIPSSLLLIPIEFAVWRLSLAERDEKVTLDKFGMLAKGTSQIFGALLPRSIAITLSDFSRVGNRGGQRGMKGGNILIAEKFQETTVLFAYVVGYEEYALTYPPEVVIKWIQALFAAFDDIVEPRHARDDADIVDDSTHDGMKVVKFETFHDFYFLVSGCPEHNDKHAEECVSTALKLVRAASGILNPAGEQTHLKLGINSGAVCAGVIGDDSPRFTCIGDTVNTASRMASTSFSCTLKEALCIQISDSTKKRLSPEYLEVLRSGKEMGLGNVQVEVIPRSSPIDIKGKGVMETSFVRIVGQELPGDQGQAMPGSRTAAAAEIKPTTSDSQATAAQSSHLAPLKNISNNCDEDTNSSQTSTVWTLSTGLESRPDFGL